MKVKRPQLLTRLRKDPKALHALLDFARRRDSGDGANSQNITIDHKPYTLRKVPALTG